MNTNLIKNICDKISITNTLLLDFEFFENHLDFNKSININLHMRTEELDGKTFFNKLTTFLYDDYGITKLLENLFQEYNSQKLTIPQLAEEIFSEKNRLPSHILEVLSFILIKFKSKIEKLHNENKDFYLHPVLKSDMFLLRKILEDTSLFLVSLIPEEDIFNFQIPHAISRKKIDANSSFDLSLYFLGNENNFFLQNEGISPLLSSFFLRQSIELKVFETLGILRILDKNDKPYKMSANYLFKLLEDLENNVIFPKDITKELLIKINKWCNSFIHFGVSDYFYTVYFAYLILEDFFSNNLFIKESYYLNIQNILSEKINNNRSKKIIKISQKDSKNLNWVIKNDEDFKNFKKCLHQISYSEFIEYYHNWRFKYNIYNDNPKYKIFLKTLNLID